MKFGIQSLMLLTAATALAYVSVIHVVVGAIMVGLLLPAMVLLIGLTAEQKGTSLNVSSHQGFKGAVKVWLMLLVLQLIFASIIFSVPPLRRAVRRVQFEKAFDFDSLLPDEVRERRQKARYRTNGWRGN